MSTQTQTFSFKETQVRTLLISGQPYFFAKDVALILGYDNWRMHTLKICRGYIHYPYDDTMGAKTDEIIVPERDVYRLIIHSDCKIADRFEDWVFMEMRPLLREMNCVDTPKRIESILENPKDESHLLVQIKNEQQKVRMAEDTINRLMHTEKTYSTSELAKELGFTSANKLNEFLQDHKVLYRSNGTWLPYCHYADKDIIAIKQGFLPGGIVTYQSRWTQKGRKFLLELLEKPGSGHSNCKNQQMNKL